MYSLPLSRTSTSSTISSTSIPIGILPCLLPPHPSTLELTACPFGTPQNPQPTPNTSRTRLPAYPMHTRLSSIHPALRPVHPALRDVPVSKIEGDCESRDGSGSAGGGGRGGMPGKLNSNQLHYITHPTCIVDSSDAAPRITVPCIRRRGTAARSKPAVLPASNAVAAAPTAPQKKKGLRRFMCLQSPRRGRKLVKREVRARVVEAERWKKIEGFLEGGRGHSGEGVVTKVRWDLED